MKITFNTDKITKYHLDLYEEPLKSIKNKNDDYYLLIIDEMDPHYFIDKLSSKQIKITEFNKYEKIYKFPKTSKDIEIDVKLVNASIIKIINNYDNEYNEEYNYPYNESNQIIIEDYIDNHLLNKITFKDDLGNLINPKNIKDFKLSSYKKSLRHYIDFKTPSYDLFIYLDYKKDINNELNYEDGASFLSDEEYNKLFSNII